MNAEHFSEWLRMRGHRVIQTEHSYWYNAGPRTMQAFPYHWVIEPEEEEIRSLILRNKLLAIRYSTPLSARLGCISYHVIYNGLVYSMEQLDRRTRQNVKKGLSNCVVEPISFERLSEEGWLLEKDTLARQNRQGATTRDEWQLMCDASAKTPGFEAWGALVDGTLGASLLTFRCDDCCEMIYQQCHRDFINERVNNALTYSVTQEMVARSEIKSIFYALHSLDAPPNIDEFKLRMGYQLKPLRQRVVIHPWLRFFATNGSCKLLSFLTRSGIRSVFLSKAEGMFRFYLQGLLPAEQQAWSPHLENEKLEYLDLCQ